MDEPFGFDSIDHVGALATLAGSAEAQRRVRRRFGDRAPGALKAMREGDLEGIGAEAHDFFLDEMLNEAATYWEASVVGGDGDDYPVCVRGLGGVFFVQSVDYEDVGYFRSAEDAVAWVNSNWDNVQE
jgi:hypothetical protein